MLIHIALSTTKLFMFLQNQHGPKNQGRCGVCGEEYSDPNKKLEPGPTNKFATGLITGNYQQGETSIYTYES